MADYYFQMKDLSVGYNGNSLIYDINIGDQQGGDRDFDRSEWFGKVNDFEKYYKTAESRWWKCIFLMILLF